MHHINVPRNMKSINRTYLINDVLRKEMKNNGKMDSFFYKNMSMVQKFGTNFSLSSFEGFVNGSLFLE